MPEEVGSDARHPLSPNQLVPNRAHNATPFDNVEKRIMQMRKKESGRETIQTVFPTQVILCRELAYSKKFDTILCHLAIYFSMHIIPQSIDTSFI